MKRGSRPRPDHDAQHRQTRAQLVAADRVRRHANDFGELVSANHKRTGSRLPLERPGTFALAPDPGSPKPRAGSLLHLKSQRYDWVQTRGFARRIDSKE